MYIGNPKKEWGWTLSSQQNWDKPVGVMDVAGDGMSDIIIMNGNGELHAIFPERIIGDHEPPLIIVPMTSAYLGKAPTWTMSSDEKILSFSGFDWWGWSTVPLTPVKN